MFRRAIFMAALVVLASRPSQAATIFYADLTHDQEALGVGLLPLTPSTGAPRALSFGNATFVLNDAQTQLTMIANIYNIDVTGSQTTDTFDNLVAAHIHVGAAPGANAPVRWGFFGAPDNDTNPKQFLLTPFVGSVGGTFTSIWDQPEGNAGTTLTTNLPAILAGLSYVNFHTTQFGGGEIRGQLIPTPEPSSLVLVGLGGIGLYVARRRRIRQR